MRSIRRGAFAIFTFLCLSAFFYVHQIAFGYFHDADPVNEANFQGTLESLDQYSVGSLHLVQYNDGYAQLFEKTNNVGGYRFFAVSTGWILNSEEPDPEACERDSGIPGCAQAGSPPPWDPYLFSTRTECLREPGWGSLMGALVDVTWIDPPDTDYYEVYYAESQGPLNHWFNTTETEIRDIEVIGPNFLWEYNYTEWDLTIKACNEHGCTEYSNWAYLYQEMWPCYG